MPIKPDAHYRYAHDRAAVERNSQGGVQALLGLDHGAGVCADGDAHADEARKRGPDRSRQVGQGSGGDRPPVVCFDPAKQVVVDEGGQHDEDDDDEYREEPVLPRQEGHRALLDGTAYELDGLVALVLLEDIEREQEGEYEPDSCRDEGHDEDHFSLSMKRPPLGGRP